VCGFALFDFERHGDSRYGLVKVRVRVTARASRVRVGSGLAFA
jgi:hypothetical protein